MAENPKPPPSVKAVAALAFLSASVLFAGLAVAIPLGLNQDEPAHLGYVGFLAREKRLPRFPEDDVLQAQHPPLYHAVMALVAGAARAIEPGRPIDAEPDAGFFPLPYERRIAFRPSRVVDDPLESPLSGRSSRPRDPGDPARTFEWAVFLLRFAGLPALLACGLVIFRATARVADRATAALAAATTLLVPQFVASFARVGNDGLAALLATAGFAAAIGAGPDARASTRRLLASGALFGLAFLAKATAAGPFVAALIMAAFARRATTATRARDVALLCAGPIALAAWWYVRHALMMGTLDVAPYEAERHRDMLRFVAPDALGLADLVGVMALSWFGFVGGENLTAGYGFFVLGAALPLVAVGGALATLGARGARRFDRAAAGAFLAGLAVQFALLMAENLRVTLVHGRYMNVLALPGAIAAAVGARRLFGRLAPRVLWATTAIAAVAGLVVLHARVIPQYNPPWDRYASPDFAAYVDCGSFRDAAAIERGGPRPEGQWFVQRPEGTAAVDATEVRVRARGLDPDGAFVAWLRIHQLSHEVSAEEFRVGDRPLAGPMSAAGLPGWIRAPIPRGATSDGSVVVSARRLIGDPANVAELLVTRMPLAVGAAKEAGGAVEIALTSSAPERLPSFAASLRRDGGAQAAEVPVAFDAGGRATLRFPAPPGAPARLLLTLVEPARIWSDVKIAGLAVGRTEKTGRFGTPGLAVARAPAGAHPGDVLFEIPGGLYPPGVYRMELTDESGAPLSGGRLALAAADGRRIEAQGGVFEVGAPNPALSAARLLYVGGAPFLVDRLRIRRSAEWVYELKTAP